MRHGGRAASRACGGRRASARRHPVGRMSLSERPLTWTPTPPPPSTRRGWTRCCRTSARSSAVGTRTAGGPRTARPQGRGRAVRAPGHAAAALRAGGQEQGRRPGTENVPYAVALSTACELVRVRPARGTVAGVALRECESGCGRRLLSHSAKVHSRCPLLHPLLPGRRCLGRHAHLFRNCMGERHPRLLRNCMGGYENVTPKKVSEEGVKGLETLQLTPFSMPRRRSGPLTPSPESSLPSVQRELSNEPPCAGASTTLMQNMQANKAERPHRRPIPR